MKESNIKWKDRLYSCIRRISILKISIFPTVSHRFNAIWIKITIRITQRNRENILKIFWKLKRPKIMKTILGNKACRLPALGHVYHSNPWFQNSITNSRYSYLWKTWPQWIYEVFGGYLGKSHNTMLATDSSLQMFWDFFIIHKISPASYYSKLSYPVRHTLKFTSCVCLGSTYSKMSLHSWIPTWFTRQYWQPSFVKEENTA